MIAGLVTVAAGYIYVGALIIICSRGILSTVGPVLAAEKSTDRIAALASYATWNDVGLAGGAFLGTVGVASLGSTPTYSLMATALLLATAWQFFDVQKRRVSKLKQKGKRSMATAQRIVLASRPVGEPKPENFRLEKVAVPSAGTRAGPAADDLALARSLHARAHERRGVLCAPVQIDQVMEGGHGQRSRRVQPSGFQAG